MRKPPDYGPPNTLKSPEGGTRTAGVRKPPDLGAHPTPLNAQRATYEVSGKRLFPHAYRLKPLACSRLFGFSPEGGTRTAGVRKPPDCVFSIGLMIVE